MLNEAFKVLQDAYDEKTEAIYAAKSQRASVGLELCGAFLALKGVEVEQTVKVVDEYGKETLGVFRIIDSDDTADIRFFPYRKDGELGKNPRVFDFGVIPNLSWEPTIAKVEICAPPDKVEEE